MSILLLLLAVAWIAASMKTSRFDGDLIPDLHPYRRLMAFIMRKKTEATVYFDTYVDADKLLAYIDDASTQFHTDVTHCLVGASMVGMSEVPSMNRFVVGRRLYQRKFVEVSFSMKRKRRDRKAKVANVKVRLQPGETFRALCDRIQADILFERSDAVTQEDKEFGLFSALPRPLLVAAVAVAQWLDYYNLAPRALIEPDALYTSLYVANLGSIGMDPGFHHLYEWGHCPLFMMAGKIELRPVVVDGAIELRRQLHIRWSYDERIDDGLTAGMGIAAVKKALENPYEYLGCLAADHSDARPLDTMAPAASGRSSAESGSSTAAR